MANREDYTFSGLINALAEGRFLEERKRRQAVFAKVHAHIEKSKEKSKQLYARHCVTLGDDFSTLSQEDKSLIIKEYRRMFDDLDIYFRALEKEVAHMPLQGFAKLQSPVNELLVLCQKRLIELGENFEK
jgi:hypothetical protein